MANDLETDTDKDYIRLHVGGLSPDVTEKDLRDRFNSFGKILSIDVVKGYDCACRGFAYVNFDKSADIKKCISILDRTRWRGNLVTIQRANADYMAKRSAELEARRKREEEIRAKEKDSSVTVEENAASKDKDGLWVVNKHGLVLPVLRIANNNGKVLKINPNSNKYKNNVKKLATDHSGEEEINFRDDEIGEAPKKISEDIEIITEDQMEIEEETPATKAEVGYPFSDDEDDRNYESRDEDDEVPVVPANIQKEKKSALSILEQMFPEEKDFIHKKDAKMEKIRAVAMKETVPVGPGVKEALAKIEAKKAAEKAAALAKQAPAKVEPVKENKTKEVEKKAEPVKETKPKEVEKKAELIKEVKPKEAEKKKQVAPAKKEEIKVPEVVVEEKKSEPVSQPTVNTKKRSREEESSSSSSNDEGDHDDSSSTTSSASSSTEFFESIKRRKIMESANPSAFETKKAKKAETKAKPVVQEKPKATPVVEVAKVVEKVEEKEKDSSSSSSDDEGSDSDSDSSSTTSSASSSTEFFEEIRRRKLLEQNGKEDKPGKAKAKAAKQKEPVVVSKPAEPEPAKKEAKKTETKKDNEPEHYKPVEPSAQESGTEMQGMQVDEENGKSWVDIMTQYETERLKPVTILAPKAVWKLFPDRDDSTTPALAGTSASGNAMEVEATTDKPDEEADIGVKSKDFKPFFPFIGNSAKLIGDTLVRTKTLEEIEDEWRREKVFLTQDYKKKRSVAVKKRRKLEKKQR